jgi:tetratricopeptide (TPR) repeat protein
MSPKKKRKKPKQQTSPRVPKPVTPPPVPPSGGRLWLFRLAALLLAPVLFLLLLEGGLRLFGYGFSPAFLIEEQGTLRTNPAFGRICFPPELVRVPVAARLADPKPDGEYRIFILGASAALGFPTPEYSFGRLLEVMLEERYPDTRFEVINVGMAAINSHIVLPIAKDVLDHEADLLVVYMGNNEVVGPFGPGTVFADFSPNIALIRTSLAVKRARTGQLLGNLINLSRTKSAGWDGMNMFVENHVAADDRRLQRVYDHFRRNLADILQSARQKGVPVVVSTLATNLKDSPPFGSMHRHDLSAADLEHWQRIYDAGVELEDSMLLDEAAARYREALRIDDNYADLHFRLARCLLALGETAAARDSYLQAQELDTLRFRADAGINAAVMEVAGGREELGIHLVDAAGLFASSAWSTGGIPGEELFDDHVHMSFSGNYLLASEVFDRVAPILPSSITGGGMAPEAPSLELCARRLVFTEYEQGLQLKLIADLTDKPPFTGQIDHEKRQALHKERMLLFDRTMSIARVREVGDLYEAEINRAADDHWLRLVYAKLLVKLGDMEEATTQLSAIIADNPFHREALWQYAKILAKQGRYEEEGRYINRVLEIDPFFMQGRTRQAVNMMQRGKKEESVRLYRELIEDYPGNARLHGGIARVLMSQGKVAEATEAYREALRIDPVFSEARADLVQLNVSRGNLPAAIAECEEWIKLAPMETTPLLTLAAVLERKGDAGAAAAQYKKAIALNPRSFQARVRYGTLLQKRGALFEATAFHRRMLESDPDIPAGHYLLGISLARQGKSAEAVDELRKELELAPESPKALTALARLLSSDYNPLVRDGVAAVAIAERLTEVARDDPDALDAIAMAYAEFGDFDRALEYQAKAVHLLRTSGRREQARLRDYMARMQLYRAGTPYRPKRSFNR